MRKSRDAGRKTKDAKGTPKPVVRITALTAADVDELCALAGQIWRAHYPAIISPAQIEYMLAQRYAPAVVREELPRGDLWWDQLRVDGRMVGFASYFLTRNPGEVKLDKLYVHPDRQRRGYGGMLLDRAVTMVRAYGGETLVLAVNKRNRNAIAAYEKYGFTIVDSVVKDIGGGFVMDDYIMSRDV
jgi:ribosomal protein S18 acetylase RimI-like enzyme